MRICVYYVSHIFHVHSHSALFQYFVDSLLQEGADADGLLA